MSNNYAINISLLPHQLSFFQLLDRDDPPPHPLLVGGFGCGKTFTIVAASVHLMLKYPGILGAIYEPTYGDIMDIIIPEFRSFFNSYGMWCEYNGRTSEMKTPFGTVLLKSMHEPENIKGYEVGWGLVDEIDTMKPHKAELAWNKILGRARIPLPDGRTNIVGAATTPEGFGFVYKRWVENANEGYVRVHGKTTTSMKAGFISKTYVNNLMASYPVELQRAYLEGEFVNMSSSSFYYGFSSDLIKDVELDETIPLALCFDFNVDPAVAVIAQARTGEDIRVIDEVYIRNSNTQGVCQQIKNKFIDNGKNIDVKVFGDATGSSRDTRSGTSDYRIIRHELEPFFRSFKFKVPKKNPPIRDRDNTVNNALEKQFISISSKCRNLIKDFRQVTRKGNDIDKSDMDLTHISDAFGYFLCQEFPIYRERQHAKAKML